VQMLIQGNRHISCGSILHFDIIRWRLALRDKLARSAGVDTNLLLRFCGAGSFLPSSGGFAASSDCIFFFKC
jgi:hypothetical protein